MRQTVGTDNNNSSLVKSVEVSEKPPNLFSWHFVFNRKFHFRNLPMKRIVAVRGAENEESLTPPRTFTKKLFPL